MIYGLMLSEDNRILGLYDEHFIPEEGVLRIESDGCPEPLGDYKYIDNEFVYDPAPPIQEPDPEPSKLDRIEAQVLFTALMTDTFLEDS